ncbi:MAG: NERD domain-containing protein kinase family protein [Acidimicrobiales bacterium]
MAEIKSFGDGIAGSRARGVAQALQTSLPDSMTVLPDLSINDVHGRRWHFDLVVLAPHAVYVVELYDWTGNVVGDHFQWSIDGIARWAPQALIEHKRTVLREYLTGRDQRLASVWFEPVTVLTQKPASLNVTPDAQAGITGVKGLASLVSSPESLPVKGSRDGLAGSQTLLTLSRLGFTSTDSTVVGPYRVVEHLESSEWHDLFRVTSTSTQGGPMRLLRADRGPELRELSSIHEQWAELAGHPGLPAIIDLFGDDQLGACTVFAEPEGRTLRALLQQGFDASESMVLGWIRDCGEAIADCHTEGVVHGRIAPEYVSISPAGAASITGPAPGISTPRTAQPQKGVDPAPLLHGVGRYIDPAFLAPELSEPDVAPGPAADIFGIAAIVHFLFSGDTDFVNDGSQTLTNCPAALAELLPSMLEPNPVDRLSSMDPLLDVIEELITAQRQRIDLAGVPQVDADYLINGRYTVVQRLGIGPAWASFRLLDGVTGDIKVGKVFDSAIPPSSLNRIARRTPVDSMVSAPEVVTDGDNRTWMISDFIQGSALSEITSSGDPLVPAEAIAMVDSLLQVFAEMHPDVRAIQELDGWATAGLLRPEERSRLRQLRSVGFVHGDIKPSSIVRVAGGVTLVDPLVRLDFDDLPPPEHPYVDPDPESGLDRSDVGPDLFAAGVLLYELVCGIHPYSSGTPSIDCEPVDPLDLDLDIEPRLAEFLTRACAQRRSARFVDAPEMRRELLKTSQLVIDQKVLARDTLYRGFWIEVQSRASLHGHKWFDGVDVPDEWTVRFDTYRHDVALGARSLRRSVELVVEFPPAEAERFAALAQRQGELQTLYQGPVNFDHEYQQVTDTIPGQVSDAPSRPRLASTLVARALRLVTAIEQLGVLVVDSSFGPAEADDFIARKVSGRWVLESEATSTDGEISRVSRVDEELDDIESAIAGDRPASEPVIDLTERGLPFIESPWMAEAEEDQRDLAESLLAAARDLGGVVVNDANGAMVLAWAVDRRDRPLPVAHIDGSGITFRTDLLATVEPFDNRRALRTLRHRLAAFVQSDWMGLAKPKQAAVGWPVDSEAELLQLLDWVIQQMRVRHGEELMTAARMGDVLELSVSEVLEAARKMGLLVEDLPLLTRRSAFAVAAELGVVADELSE